MGKIPGKILEIGKRKGIPVMAISGCVEDEKILKSAGFKGVYATKPENMSLEEAMTKDVAIRNISFVIQNGTKWNEESR